MCVIYTSSTRNLLCFDCATGTMIMVMMMTFLLRLVYAFRTMGYLSVVGGFGGALGVSIVPVTMARTSSGTSTVTCRSDLVAVVAVLRILSFRVVAVVVFQGPTTSTSTSG